MTLRSLVRTQFTAGVAASTPAAIPSFLVGDKASGAAQIIEYNRKIKISNDNGSGTIYVRFSTAANPVQATVNDTPVNPNNPVFFELGFNESMYSFIGSVATMPGTIELVTGEN